MEKRSFEAMSVRVPLPIAKELKKLKEEQELPSIGSALQIYIENIKIERLQSQLNDLQTAIQESNQVIQLNQASIILNSNMIAMILKGVTPEKITDNPEAQKQLENAIKYIENNQARINSFVQAGLDQGKKLQKKYPAKQQKTEDNRVNS
ncbi:unnamed protein product, partial [marine sediment metagenome]